MSGCQGAWGVDLRCPLLDGHSEPCALDYHVQPMTGVVHRDAQCSTGTARYGTAPGTLPAAEMVALIAAGSVKTCKTCWR